MPLFMAIWPIDAKKMQTSTRISANIAPRDLAAMWDAWQEGDTEEAKRLHYKTDPLNYAMFIETNPLPVKTALVLMGRIKEEFRLPLCRMSDENRKKLKKVLKDYRLI